eukprot:1728494-Ditylum_brightwellii.AAC.1
MFFDYLRAFRRPKKVTPRDHLERVGTLVWYANKLPGLSPAMHPDKVKKMVFNQHPKKWRKTYIRTGKQLQNETL